MPSFKLKRAGARAFSAHFPDMPRWSDLALQISSHFGIPKNDVRVAYLDGEGDPVAFQDDKKLEAYVHSFDNTDDPIKLVVDNVKSPDPSIPGTWSLKSNLSSVSDPEKLKLFGWVLDQSSRPFSITVAKSETVDALAEEIKDKMELNGHANDFLVWKVSIPDDNNLAEKVRVLLLNNEESLRPSEEISEVFSEPPPRKSLHLVVRAPIATMTPRSSENFNLAALARDASRKRSRSPSAEPRVHRIKRKPVFILRRKWTIDGGITQDELSRYYFLDPGIQDITSVCMESIQAKQYLLLPGARASGKTTRLLWLANELRANGYRVLYTSLEGVSFDSLGNFWATFGREIRLAARNKDIQISSQRDFLDTFAVHPIGLWQKGTGVVLLIDELSEIFRAIDDIRNDLLRALRRMKQERASYVIGSVVAAGTFSIMHLNPTDSTISPFNVGNAVPNRNFSLEETKRLFHEFAKDEEIVIDEDLVLDVWAKSNGHPGLVCLCGRLISDNISRLLCHNQNTLTSQSWTRFPAKELYEQMFAYNTFRAMYTSLLLPYADSAVNLLRSRFTGHLDEVQPHSQEEEMFADFLTAEGVLAKPVPSVASYRMSSPLVDGFIRTRVIPDKFPSAPSQAPPCNSETIEVFAILTESLKYFDKNLMRLAATRSYKMPGVKIPNLRHVPRESVYDTELMRILMNWVNSRSGWSVTGQWHLQTDQKRHKYSDIVLTNESGAVVVLELLATGNPDCVTSHINKTPEYMTLLSADEGWVVHFTCEENYDPIWQSDADLQRGVNVVHFSHNLDFTTVEINARWKDYEARVCVVKETIQL